MSIPLFLSAFAAGPVSAAAAPAPTLCVPTAPPPTGIGLPPLPTPCPTPTLPPLPVPTPTPLPLPPAPSLPAVVLPPLGGGPLPGGGQSGIGQPGGSAGGLPGTGTGSGTGGVVGTVAPGSAPTSPGLSGGSAASGSFLNSSFLEYAGLFAAPPNVGVERPSLHHFELTARGGAGSNGGVVPLQRSMWPLTVAVLLVTFAIVLVAPRRTTLRLRRRAEIAALPLGVAVVMVALLMASPATGARTASTTPRISAALLGSAALVQPALSPREAVWSRLTAIETKISEQHARLVSLSTPTTGRADDLTSPPVLGSSSARNSQQVRDQAVAEYQSAVQAEYDFFVRTVSNATQRQDLIAAAASSPAPVRDAVAYNVAAIQTALAQEAAISKAERAVPVAAGPAPTALQVPMNGVVSQPFGPSNFGLEPAITYRGFFYRHFHTGLDLAAPINSPVRAAADGVVALATSSRDSSGRLVGYGNYLVISHPGKTVTLYGHLNELVVHAGQVVHAGDLIGLEGSTGYSTGPHLHFELRVAGLLTDPLPYLTAPARTQ